MTLQLNQTYKRKVKELNNIMGHMIFRDPLRLTEQKSRRLDFLIEKLELLKPDNKLKQSKRDLITQTEKLNYLFKRYIEQKQNIFNLTLNKLELINPLSIMKKGYSVTKKDNVILKSIDQIKTGDSITVDLQDGSFNAIVKEKKKGE